jgi:hypothetical protein
MPSFLYKNLTDILTTNQPIRGDRFVYSDLNSRIIVPKFSTLNNPEDPSSPGTNVELHVFLPNGSYYTTLYNANYFIDPRVSENGEPIRFVTLPIHDHIRDLKLIQGPYRIVYNFFRDLIGSNNNADRLFISDVSSDRRELRLTLTDSTSVESIEQLTDFVVQYMRGSRYKLPIVLNFGENNIVDVINVTSDGNPTYFYVKLAEPLPFDVDLYYQCWLSSQIMKPYIDLIQVEKEFETLQPRFIKGPNFEVDYDRFITGTTEYKSWTDLLSTNVQTSQQILDKYINTSGSKVALNYDFTDFKNFVFYSSAEERIENFYYKIRLIESYNDQLSNLEVYTGSLDTNKTKIKMLREKVVSGFDEFEKWLYYETSASLKYTSELTSSLKPFPKYEVTGSSYNLISKLGKYNLYDTTSDQVQNWYNNTLDLATDFDMSNSSALVKSLPDHVYDNTDNAQILTFVNMLGQHFDILYFYTDHILKKNLRIEHPKDGLSQDLIYEATRNLGWTLSSGTKTKDLWEYALGLSGSGEPIWTGRTTVGKQYSKSEEERTKEVWRRVLNNLPYIYKSKGTARGVKALLAAYGIPQTLLSIREYGGPDNADLGITPRAEWEKHTYYLSFPGSLQQPMTSSYVSVPWERVNNEDNVWQYPDTLTFRWKMNPSEYYRYENNELQTVLQKETSGNRIDWFVTVNRTGSDEKGDLTFYLGDGTNYKTASIKNEYLYDDIPLNIMIRRNISDDTLSSNNTYDFILKTSKYGKITVDRSASISINGSSESNYNRGWSSDGTLFIGYGSSNIQTSSLLSGSIFELRYWTKPLLTSSFDNHVMAARSYNGNTPTSSFYDLQAQWKFWQPFNAEVTASIKSMHPDQKKSNFFSSPKDAYFYQLNRDSFVSTVEVYNMEVATIANNTPFSEKIRIDSASLQGALKIDESTTVTAFDRFSIDSNKLMVAFSPQHVINEDIYEAIGYTVLDDYLGEYSNVNKDEYPALKRFAQEYWKKYTTRNDFTAYLRLVSLFDFSVFDQIRQTLPIRTNEILGLVVEPNVLERSKVKTNRDFGGLPPTKYVRDTTEISASAVISVDVSTSKKTTIMIGFDEEIPSEFTNVSGEFDIETIIESETDNLEDDVDIVTNLITNVSNTTASLSAKIKNISLETTMQNTSIQLRPQNFSVEQNKYINLFIDSKLKRKVLGRYNTLDSSASLDLGFTNTFNRTNYIYGGSVSSSKSWYTASNQYNKRTATFEMIGNGRHDNFYKSYYFYYTSSLNFDSSNYSQYEYVTSSQMNMNNYPQSVRSIRFDGCKLPGGDVTNKISYPMYTPNYTYLDINNDPSALIILVLPFEVLPEWLQQIREARGQI